MVRKHYLCLAAALCMMSAASVQGQTAYAGLAYSDWASENGVNNRIISFDVNDPSTVLNTYCSFAATDYEIVTAGASLGDTYYGFVRTSMFLYDFCSFNFEGSAISTLGSGYSTTPLDMTYDPATDAIYATTNNGRDILTVDRTTGEMSTYLTLEDVSGIVGIAADGNGVLWLAGSSRGSAENQTIVELYSLNLLAGNRISPAREVGTITTVFSQVTLYTMAYEPESGHLFLTADRYVCDIDPAAGTMEVLENRLPDYVRGLTFTMSNTLAEGGNTGGGDDDDTDDGVRTIEYQTWGDALGASTDVMTKKTIYYYDGNNNVIRDLTYDCVAGMPMEFTTYTYNEEGLLIESSSEQYGQFDDADWVFQATSDTVRYEYDEQGRLIRTYDVYQDSYTEYQYDDQGQLVYEGRILNDWGNEFGGGYYTVESKTYSDFIAFNKPQHIEGDGAYESYVWDMNVYYDENQNKIRTEKWSSDGETLRDVERYTYDDSGMLILYEQVSATYNEATGEWEDALKAGDKRTEYELVDGDIYRVREIVSAYDPDYGWVANTYNKVTVSAQLDPATAAELTAVEPVEDAVSAYRLSIRVPDVAVAGGSMAFDVYRHGILMGRVSAADADETGIVSYVDNIVPNGSYEYFVQTVIEPDVAIDDETLCNVSNVMGITAHVDLPAPQNVQFISHENDGTNDLVTIGWDQAADLDPDLLFKSFNVFQVGSRVPDNRDDATGIIEELTDTEYTMNFLYRVRDVYVQNVFAYGKANSDTITIDLDNIGIAEGQNAAENRIVVEGDQVVATGGVAASIAVYGANGTLAVRGENTDRVSIANLPQGVYVAVVLRDGKGLATKFVKE